MGEYDCVSMFPKNLADLERTAKWIYESEDLNFFPVRFQPSQPEEIGLRLRVC